MKSFNESLARVPTKPVAAFVSALLSATLAATAHAQVQPAHDASSQSQTGTGDPLEEVVVTGTQLHGVAAPIGSALLVVGQDDIQSSGQQTTADVIRQLPFVSQIGAGEETSNSTANLGSLNITRAQGINLRGLGTQATLALLDGRRVVPGGEGAQLFDPSSLPAIALERIEIVPDGASATYGTDAVAGVVNLIMRKNFNGAEVTVSQGWADDFSAQQRVGAIFGHTWEGGSFTVAGEFFHHPDLAASSRASLYQDDQTPFGGSDLRNLVGAPGNITVGGTLYGLPPGNGVGVTPASFSTAVNRTSQWDDYSALPSDNRASVVINAEQHVSDGVKIWMEGYYTNRRTISQDEPLQLTGIQVPSTNPFFIPAAAGPCSSGPGLCDSVNYSFVNDVGDEIIHATEQAYQLALGTDIELGHDFHFELYGTTNQDAESDKFTGLNSTAVASALADADPTTALNVFGSGGSNNNPATLATLVGYNNYTTHYFMNLLNAKVDGPVYELPGGAVRVALGAEFHHDELHSLNYGDTGTSSVGVFATTANNTTARSVSSAYIEGVVPIFGPQNAVPGAARLELDVAGRYDHYSDFGSTENPKFGLRWDPIDGLTTHASFGRSFRAPTLCDVNPQCTGGTVTVPFPDLGWQKNNPPSVFGPGVSLTAEEVGGNAALKPETAKSFSFGVDWHPQDSGLDTSIDYYHIDYKNIIDAPAAFNPAAGLLPEYAQFVTRNPTLAQVLVAFARPGTAPQTFPPQLVNLIVNGTRQNVGEALTDGLDISVKKSWDTVWGKWLAGINGTYVLKYDYSLVPGAPLLDVLNTVQGSGNAYPLRFTARAQLGWQQLGFRVNGFINYHNAYTNTAPPAGLPNESIASYTTVDLSVGYNTGQTPQLSALHDLSVSLSAINLFNRLPPFALIGTQAFDSTTGGPLGRLVTLELSKKF